MKQLIGGALDQDSRQPERAINFDRVCESQQSCRGEGLIIIRDLHLNAPIMDFAVTWIETRTELCARLRAEPSGP